MTLGSSLGDPALEAPASAAWSTRVSVRSVCGAASSAPGANTTKKLGSNRAQSTSRRLAIRVVIGTPCTSQTISSPDADAELAGEIALDRDLRWRRTPAVHQLPATTRSDETSVSR